jgi:hypothetical protein
VLSPMLKGLFGLNADALSYTLTLAPALPANWNSYALQNVRVGSVASDIKFQRSDNELSLEVDRSGSGDLFLDFQPALSLRAKVTAVTLNGRPVGFKLKPNDTNQHLEVHFPVYGSVNVLRVQVRHDFTVTYSSQLPVPGARSEGLRILSESWSASRDELTLDLEGLPGKPYQLFVSSGKEVESVTGGALEKSANLIDVSLPSPVSGKDVYVRSTLVLRFVH